MGHLAFEHSSLFLSGRSFGNIYPTIFCAHSEVLWSYDDEDGDMKMTSFDVADSAHAHVFCKEVLCVCFDIIFLVLFIS